MTRSSSSLAGLAACALLALPAALSAQTFTATRHDIKGDGRFDYLVAEPGTGRVFVSRSTHFMVVDGATGKVLGDILNTPATHGVALVPKHNHGFTTNSGDSTLTMFDLATLKVIKKIPMHTGGLDGIMYDDFSDHVILTNHSRPDGTATAVDGDTGAIVGVAKLEDNAPEGAASDGKGKLFVNNEGKNSIQVIDAKSMKVTDTWSIAPCDGPTGIAYDRANDVIFSGCGETSVVTDAKTGKVIAQIKNGDGVDALGWDPSQKLIYIPAGGDGTVTVVHQDARDKYTVLATVKTMRGARTIAVDPVKHVAYTFTPEFGPPPAGAAGAAGAGGAAGRGGRGRGPTGPQIGAWLYTITH